MLYVLLKLKLHLLTKLIVITLQSTDIFSYSTFKQCAHIYCWDLRSQVYRINKHLMRPLRSVQVHPAGQMYHLYANCEQKMAEL